MLPTPPSVTPRSVETANDAALYHGASLLLRTGQLDSATKLLDRMSRSGSMAGNALSVKANTLRGWVELSAGINPNSPTGVLQVESFFTSSLEAAAASSDGGGGAGGQAAAGGGGSGGLELDALLGLSACRGVVQDWAGVLDALNRGIATAQSLSGVGGLVVPFLVEKARVMMNKGDWSQAEAMAERVVAEDKGNVAALRLLALHAATQVKI